MKTLLAAVAALSFLLLPGLAQAGYWHHRPHSYHQNHQSHQSHHNYGRYYGHYRSHPFSHWRWR